MRDRLDSVAESVADRPEVVAAMLSRHPTHASGRCDFTGPSPMDVAQPSRSIPEPTRAAAAYRAAR